jgi:hypothetical protein
MKVSNEKGIKWQVDKYMERERERACHRRWKK